MADPDESGFLDGSINPHEAIPATQRMGTHTRRKIESITVSTSYPRLRLRGGDVQDSGGQPAAVGALVPGLAVRSVLRSQPRVAPWVARTLPHPRHPAALQPWAARGDATTTLQRQPASPALSSLRNLEYHSAVIQLAGVNRTVCWRL
jgi:hypothetical protein